MKLLSGYSDFISSRQVYLKKIFGVCNMEELSLNSATAVSSVDGRYARTTKPLRQYFSEYALQKNRLFMEVKYLEFLSENSDITHVRSISDDERKTLMDIIAGYNQDEFQKIKDIEKTTNHDVKSVEYYIKEKLKGTSLEDISESTHFALTSEDCTNIAYALMVNGAVNDVFVPKLRSVVEKLTELTDCYANDPMLARTHGQPASPTTVGKEFGVFSYELAKKVVKLENICIPGKLNNATGNYNALTAAYPDINGIEFSEKFLADWIELNPKFYTTQVDGYTEYSELFNVMKEINTLLEKLDWDMWSYISYNDFVQKRKEGEVGSSTMPHKVNPIQFENSAGNILIANGIFEALNQLPKSKMQRDLSGSTMLRAMGEAFGHTLIAYENTVKGLNRIEPNLDHLREILDQHPEILSEPIQQVLRREGVAGAYEQMKELTQGRSVVVEDLSGFIEGLDIRHEVKEELYALLDPKAYLGQAPLIAKSIAKDVRLMLGLPTKQDE